MHVHPYRGNYKNSNLSTKSTPADEETVVALAKRLNITFDDMKEMTFVSLMNIMLYSIDDSDTEATQEDIDRMFG